MASIAHLDTGLLCDVLDPGLSPPSATLQKVLVLWSPTYTISLSQNTKTSQALHALHSQGILSHTNRARSTA